MAACSDSDDPLSSEKDLVTYMIPAELNSSIRSDITGYVNQNTKQITLSGKIPANKKLTVVFETTGDVYIDGKPQSSGISSNYLEDGLKYTVVAEDGSDATYELKAETLPISDIKLNISQKGITSPTEAQYDPVTDSFIITPADKWRWVDNIQSVKTWFTAEGDVYVEDDLQASGETQHDFRNDITYKVETGSGSFEEYTVRLFSPQNSGIPIMKVDIGNNEEITVKEKDYKDALISLIDYMEPVNDISEAVAGIRGRGNSTWTYPKKPYRIKFDKKTSLFGLGKAKSWVLLANYLDPTFITANVAFELGHRLGVPYTNHAYNVELFVNGTYRGNYVLTEQVQVNEYRVDIDEYEDYFLEIDTYFDEDYKFYSSRIALPVNIKSPELDNDAQIAPIEVAFNDFMDKLFDPAGNFPDNDYKDLIDIDVLIDFLLVNEICRNQEVWHPKSTFMSKTQNGKFIMGPLWDFDWGFGFKRAVRHEYFDYKESLIFYKGIDNSSDKGSTFFDKFFHDPEFVSAYKARWNEIKGSIADMDVLVGKLGKDLERSAAYDYELWPDNTSDFKTQIMEMQNYMRVRTNVLDRAINAF